MTKKKSKQDNPLLAAAAVGMVGVQVGICIFLGYLAGNYMVERFNMAGWVVVGGVLIGLAVGIVSSVLVIMKVMGGSDG